MRTQAIQTFLENLLVGIACAVERDRQSIEYDLGNTDSVVILVRAAIKEIEETCRKPFKKSKRQRYAVPIRTSAVLSRRSFTELPGTVWKPGDEHDDFTAKANILIKAALAKVGILQPDHGVHVIDDADLRLDEVSQWQF
jgi:hypothetical protein